MKSNVRRPQLSGLLPLAFCIVVLPGIALADPDYYPMDNGRACSYEAIGGDTETLTVVGTRDLMGLTVHVVDYSGGMYDEPLENYWTIGPDGDVLLHGFFRDEGGGWGRAYDPPIPQVDVPVFVGKTWQCTTQVYWLPEGTPSGVFEIGYEIVAQGPVSVPAGTFLCISVGQLPSDAAVVLGGVFTVDGRVAHRDVEPETWFSDGVGLVQYDTHDLYQLVSYGVTPIEARSWTRIKALYQ